MRIVVDHIAGSRRGQRQEFREVERLRFGRHPDNEVCFDARRDLDASSRHAELRRSGSGYSIEDVGSSNGTFVDGRRIAELALEPGGTFVVEFGAGGPRVRVWIGELDADPPPLVRGRAGTRARVAALALALVLVAAGLALLVSMRESCG